MPTHDSDPTAQEADQRVERAKASLLARFELLKQKVTEAKHKVDLRAQIENHPLPAVGIAFALGVLAALRRTRATTPAVQPNHTLTGTALAGLAAFGLRFLRELALSQLGSVAKQWWVEHDGGSPHEAHASHLADLEPFLEH